MRSTTHDEAAPRTRSSTARPTPHWRAKAGFVAASLYLASPLLLATHPEGFTALIQNAAAAGNAGMIERSNLLYPLHAEYFYLTRVGVVYLLQALMKLVGHAGDEAFFALTLTSAVAFAVATLVVVRRRGGPGHWWGAAAFVMTPGLVELGFYYNDNVVSAAFGMVGLALLPPRAALDDALLSSRLRHALRASASGAALGYAVLCRPDAVLLWPIAVAFCFLDRTGRWRLATTLASIGFGMAVVFAASSAWGGSSILQAFEDTRVFLQIHGFPRPRFDYLVVLVYALGLPQLLVLIPIGVALTWRDRAPEFGSRRAVLLLLPGLCLLYFLPNAQQVRHFYPLLAPFVVLLGARGLHWLATGGDRRMLRLRPWLVAAALVLWFAPPLDVPLRDGPRFPIGRAWSPIVWREFDGDVERNLASADAIAEQALTVPTLTVVTVQYDSDHYFQRALWRRGYLPHPASEFFPACAGGGFEGWRQPDRPGGRAHQVLHVRTENAHVNQRPFSYTEAIQLQRGFACGPVLHDTPVVVSSLFFRTEAWLWLPETRPEAVQSTRSYGYRPTPIERLGHWVGGAPRGLLAHNFLSRNRVVSLSPQDVERMKMRVDAVVDAHRVEMPPYLRTYEGIMGLFVARVAWPRTIDGETRWRPVATPTIPLPGPDERVPE